MRFEVFRDARLEWRWRLRAGNGKIIATSGEGYKRKRGCLAGIRALQRSAFARVREV